MRISDWSSDVCSSDLDEQGRYGEIVVTGDRANRFGTDTVQSGSFRNAKILDVPLTISVIPSEVLKSQQAVDLIDAVRNTAGVSTTGTGPRSEEHTSELQSLMRISYAVFCLKKKHKNVQQNNTTADITITI